MTECKRCGKCCRHHRTLFLEASISNNPLFEAMKKYLKREPYAEDANCLALGWDGDKAICLIELVFGKDAKPQICKEYPNIGNCEYGK